MDSGFCGNLSYDEKSLCQPPSGSTKIKQCCNIDAVDAKAKELQLSPGLPDTDREALLPPVTPEFKGESCDCCCTSLSILFHTPPNDICPDSQLNDSSSATQTCQYTPTEGAFDPFAPGPNSFILLAPPSRKCSQESRASVVRHLHFESLDTLVENSGDEADMGANGDDRILFEFVYRTLLEVILSMQAEGSAAEVPSSNIGYEGFKTPTSLHHLSGVAETCPCAPVKSRSKFRNTNRELCRKLDF